MSYFATSVIMAKNKSTDSVQLLADCLTMTFLCLTDLPLCAEEGPRLGTGTCPPSVSSLLLNLVSREMLRFGVQNTALTIAERSAVL
jgi:hypothetical protein